MRQSEHVQRGELDLSALQPAPDRLLLIDAQGFGPTLPQQPPQRGQIGMRFVGDVAILPGQQPLWSIYQQASMDIGQGMRQLPASSSRGVVGQVAGERRAQAERLGLGKTVEQPPMQQGARRRGLLQAAAVLPGYPFDPLSR